MTFFRTFLISVFCVVLPGALLAVDSVSITNSERRDKTTNPEEYKIDPREYVDWGNGRCPEPYDKVVRMKQLSSDGSSYISCTAEYIAPDLILTAQHCVVDDNNDISVGNKINYLDCKGNEFKASVVSYGDNSIYKGPNNKWGQHSVPVDWALLRVDDSEFYSTAMFDLADIAANSTVTVNNAGWGSMPILSDQQIRSLRESFKEYVDESKAKANFGKFQQDYIDIGDGSNLKVHKNCQINIYSKSRKKQDFHSSTCYTWGGNSGGPYYVDGKILGIVSGGVRNLPDQDVSDVITPTVQYISQEQKNCEKVTGTQWHNNVCSCKDTDKEWKNNSCECKKEEYVIGTDGRCALPPKPISSEQKSCEQEVAKRSGAQWNDGTCGCTVPDTLWNGKKCICSDPDKTVQNGSCNISPRKQELEDAKKEIIDKCFDKQKLETMSDYEFLVCIGQMIGIKELEENYKKAKEKETSFGNRMLGGLSMAATGIGGMQLAQGLAEQSADKAAEQDMQAYLATFQCKVGDKSYKGGTSGIELGGANQLIGLYTEYVELAADLKERKAALGMKSGIESQVVLDKANTGLYDDVGHGIENGTYASLYRASKGNENDKSKLSDAKDTSSNRVKVGGIAAGIGAVGGAVGNLLINSDDEDEKVTKEDCTKAGGTFKDDKCTCKDKNKKYKKGKCVDKNDNDSGFGAAAAGLGNVFGSGAGGSLQGAQGLLGQ